MMLCEIVLVLGLENELQQFSLARDQKGNFPVDNASAVS